MAWSITNEDVRTVRYTIGEFSEILYKDNCKISSFYEDVVCIEFSSDYNQNPDWANREFKIYSYCGPWYECTNPVATSRQDLIDKLNALLATSSTITIAKNGTTVGAEPAINLIEGSNITLTIADNILTNSIDVTIDASGGGGGGVTAVTGTAPIISSGGSTPDISIPQADSAHDGYLSSTDWNTFNGKVDSVTATAPISSSGGTNPDISMPQADSLNDGYLSAADWIVFNNKGNGTVTGVTATGLLTSSGGTTPDISSQVGKGKLVGRNPVTAGIMEEISVGSGLTLSGTTLSANGVTGAALTKTDDTNVTLTLTGTPTSALLQAVNVAVGWSGTLADSRIASASTWNNKVSSVAATSPITSSGGTTPTISTSMNTNKLIGRSTAGTGVMEEISIGTGLSLSGGTLSNSSPFTTPLTTKGDIYVRNGSADTRLPVGLDTQVLLADSTATTGLKWGSNTTPPALGYYGAWQDGVTQTAAVSNTGYAMIFRTTDLSNGVTVVTNGTNLTRITFANTGIYNLQFSSQFQNTGNAQQDITIWLRLNGSDVAGSSGLISVPARRSAGAGNEGHVIAGWNYLLSVVAGQYYELIWSTSDATNVTMQYYAAGNPPPSTASVILTVTQQSGILAGTGITAINSLTGSAQTMAVGTSGTDFDISSSGTAHTFNLPTASSTNRGALSSTDWSTFNNKVATTRTISTNAPLSGGGDLSANRTLSISQSATASDGYLSSTDWNTFNGKQAALVSGTNIKTINSSSILGSGNLSVGTVTSVGGTGTTAGLSLSGSVTSSGNLTLSGTLSTPVSTINDSTTVGQNLVKLVNPSAITFMRINADNTVSTLDAATFRTAIGAGTSSTNGTVTSVAALTLGTSGTDLSSTVANGTTTPVITLNVPTASATNRGVLSAADWTTFNNKGNGTVTSVTGTAPVVSSGGTTPAISMAAATSSVNGYLTSSDWSLFNSKPNYITIGNWNLGVQGGGALSTISLPGNIIKFYKIYITNTVTVTRLGCNVTAAGTAGSKGRLGIYSDVNGFPSALILDSGEFAADTIAPKLLTGLSAVLPAGVAWLCSVTNSAANVTFSSHPISNLYPLASLAPNGGNNANYTHYSGTFAYAALPATTSALTLGLLTTTVPAVYFYA